MSVEWIVLGFLGVVAIVVITGCLLAPLDEEEGEEPPWVTDGLEEVHFQN